MNSLRKDLAAVAVIMSLCLIDTVMGCGFTCPECWDADPYIYGRCDYYRCDPLCQKCENDDCVPKCSPSTTCCADGSCCNRECCGSTCSSGCWTTNTNEGSIVPCPPCSNGSCSGTATERNDYQVCAQAATGQSGWCKCHMTEQVVGYTYPCKINYNCSAIVVCGLGAAGCAAVCASATACPVDIVACISCIGVLAFECGGPCAFVEACEKDGSNPDNITPITRNAFSSFSDGSCSG